MGLFDRKTNTSSNGSHTNGDGSSTTSRQPEPAPDEEGRFDPREVMAPTRERTPVPVRARPPAGAEGEEPSGATVISFANQKGGVAKTTTTLNLAVALRSPATGCSASTSTPRAT